MYCFTYAGEAAIQLSKYLLKTSCSDLMNLAIVYLAEDLGIRSEGSGELSSKVHITPCSSTRVKLQYYC